MRRLLVLTTVCGAAIAVGCGGSHNNPPAAATSSKPQDAVRAAFKYATCMRRHGVPNFPDPKVSNHDGEHGIAIAINTGVSSAPAFKSAQTACRGIMPMPSPAQIAAQQHTRAAGLVSFARCMRAHGIASFPDPNPQGQIQPQTLSAAGIDIHSPAVLRAAYACVSSSHGQLTRADIAQAQNGG